MTLDPFKPDSWYYSVASRKKLERVLEIPLAELEHASLKRDFLYNPFTSRKGKKPRDIANPSERLKSIQRRIVDNMLSRIPFPAFMIGGVPGRKLHEHAEIHVGKKIVVTLDVEDCFPSISEKQVYLAFRSLLKCSDEVAHLLTRLTTFKGTLPLGNPTSNYLANLVLLPCIKRVFLLAKENNVSLGQYVDDQGLSGDNLPNDFITKAVKEFQKRGFRINRSKIRVMRSGSAQVVTNMVVNKKLSVPLKVRKKVRASVNELTQIKPDHPAYGPCYRSAFGRVKSIQKLHPSEAKKYLDMIASLPKPSLN